jgi:hypothetical protein
MAGGLMQLVAYGAQDVYLTGNPQITFWKVTYRRHTNFAMEAIEQSFNGMVDFGQRVTCVISRNGDLAYRTYFQVTLPQIEPTLVGTTTTNGYARWIDYPGERLIKSVELEIGGQRIDKQYGDWMHIWNQLTLTKEQEAGYYKMIGHTTSLTYLTDPLFEKNDEPCTTNTVSGQVGAPRQSLPTTTLYVPLQFWFCRNPGLALPLIALQYHEVKINLEIQPLSSCLFITDSLVKNTVSTGGNKAGNSFVASLSSGSIWVDYIFLDTDERRRMAQNSHEYLIEQLQFTGDESITGTTACGQSSTSIKLLFNHPCKELIWVVQPCRFVECSGDLSSFYHLGIQPFNYTDSWDVLPDSYHPYGGPRALATDTTANKAFIVSGLTNAGGELFEHAAAWDTTLADETIQSAWTARSGGTSAIPPNPIPTTNVNFGVFDNSQEIPPASYQSSVSDAGSFVLAETAHKLHLWGKNPVYKANLQLNGQDRFAARQGDYFNTVQPYQHHTRTPDTGINVYSFALRPEEHQPSGTCNFSRIDSAILKMDITQRTSDARVRVYAVNYNVLRIMSGMGGLAYSN